MKGARTCVIVSSCAAVIANSHVMGKGAKLDDYHSQSTLTFKLTVSNPASVSRVLKSIGVKSLARGSFNCFSGAYAATPIADYRVGFHVRKPVTEIPADPILVIEPRSVGQFTISIVPDATGSCGFWEAEVSVFAKFDDGTVLESETEAISMSDVEAFEHRSPEVAEIMKGLSSSQVDNQIIAIGLIPGSQMNSAQEEGILEDKIDDVDPSIRAAAADAATELKIRDLLPRIIAVRQEEKSDYERAAGIAGIYEAFADERCIAPALREIVEFDGSFVPEALINIHKFAASDQALAEAKVLFDKHVSEHWERAMLDLMYIVIAYGDQNSIPFVERILADDKSRYDDNYLLRNILVRLNGLVSGEVSRDGEYGVSKDRDADVERIKQDPFFLALVHVVALYQNNSDKYVKENAIGFLHGFAK